MLSVVVVVVVGGGGAGKQQHNYIHVMCVRTHTTYIYKTFM